MSIDNINSMTKVQTGGSQTVSASAEAKAGDAADFKKAVGAPDQSAENGETPSTAELLAEARRNLILSTGRHMQEAAKDIERENIDKGF